jgi:hypothetical protein
MLKSCISPTRFTEISPDCIHTETQPREEQVCKQIYVASEYWTYMLECENSLTDPAFLQLYEL